MLRGLDANAWVTILIQLVALLVGSIAALWAYTKYALERNFVTPVQFSIDAVVVGPFDTATIMEVLLQLRNVGSSTLVAKNIRVDLRYLNEDDKITIFDDPPERQQPLFGRLQFPHSLRDEIGEASWHRTVELPKRNGGGKGVQKGTGFLLVGHHTFVQAGVDQTYTFVTAVPKSCRYLRIFASFEYAQKPSGMHSIFLRLSRSLGLIQYSLSHVTVPHTAERVFRIADRS